MGKVGHPDPSVAHTPEVTCDLDLLYTILFIDTHHVADGVVLLRPKLGAASI